jgi:hypothetical protein
MSELEKPDEKRHIIYIVAAVVFVILVVVGLISYRGHQSNQTADANADLLIAAIVDAGYPAPDKDLVVGVLGDDGGATCDDPSEALTKATLDRMLYNGAAGPGARPVIGDNKAVQGQLLIISIYCPDELPDFQEIADDLDLDDTVNY